MKPAVFRRPDAVQAATLVRALFNFHDSDATWTVSPLDTCAAARLLPGLIVARGLTRLCSVPTQALSASAPRQCARHPTVMACPQLHTARMHGSCCLRSSHAKPLAQPPIVTAKPALSCLAFHGADAGQHCWSTAPGPLCSWTWCPGSNILPCADYAGWRQQGQRRGPARLRGPTLCCHHQPNSVST